MYISENGLDWSSFLSNQPMSNLYFSHSLWWSSLGSGGYGKLGVSQDGKEWHNATNYPVISRVLVDSSDFFYVVAMSPEQQKAKVLRSKTGYSWDEAGALTIKGVSNAQLSSFAAYGHGMFVMHISYFDYSRNTSRTALINSPMPGLNYSMITQFSSYDNIYPHSLSFDARTELFLLAVDNCLFLSQDSVSWNKIQIGPLSTSIVAFEIAASSAAAVLSSGEVLMSDPGYTMWRVVWQVPELRAYPTVLLVYMDSDDEWALLAPQGSVYVSK